MKDRFSHKFGIISLIIGCIVSLLLSAVTQAQQQKVQMFNIKGFYASAFFSNQFSKDCVQSWSEVAIGDEVIKNAPGKPAGSSNGWISIVQFDRCSGNLLRSAFGSFIVLPGQWNRSQQLSDAKLSVPSVQLFDYFTNTLHIVKIDVMWTGTGPTNRVNGHFNQFSPFTISKSRINGSYREASASAKISDGLTDFGGESQFAWLSQVNSGSVSIQR